MYIMSILKANHNKDYSVVKTFRAALPSGRRSLFGAGRCGVSLLEGVASNEVRARGRLSPQKKFKKCPDLLTIRVSEVIFSAQVCSIGVFLLVRQRS